MELLCSPPRHGRSGDRTLILYGHNRTTAQGAGLSGLQHQLGTCIAGHTMAAREEYNAGRPVHADHTCPVLIVTVLTGLHSGSTREGCCLGRQKHPNRVLCNAQALAHLHMHIGCKSCVALDGFLSLNSAKPQEKWRNVDSRRWHDDGMAKLSWAGGACAHHDHRACLQCLMHLT